MAIVCFGGAKYIHSSKSESSDQSHDRTRYLARKPARSHSPEV